MNITILARSPPAGFFLCPKSSNKQGEELMIGRWKTAALNWQLLSTAASRCSTLS